MTPAIAGLAIAALLLSGTTPTPSAAPGVGARVESDSDTAPREVSRCIAYNIGRKMPELRVRNHPAGAPDEDGYLILSTAAPSPRTFGVIRVERSAAGSHLTTWLPAGSLSAVPADIAHKLIAGC